MKNQECREGEGADSLGRNVAKNIVQILPGNGVGNNVLGLKGWDDGDDGDGEQTLFEVEWICSSACRMSTSPSK